MSPRLTHWSYWDDPTRALCGQTIRRQDVATPPTCPDCARRLAERQLDDDETVQALMAEGYL